MKLVYVAGAYSADNVIGVLDNMRNGMREATKVFLAGFAPFCPWHDFHYQLMLRDGESLKVSDYYEYSLSWLRVSDAVLVVPGFERSTGTAKELDEARSIYIPIYYDIPALIGGEKCQ